MATFVSDTDLRAVIPDRAQGRRTYIANSDASVLNSGDDFPSPTKGETNGYSIIASGAIVSGRDLTIIARYLLTLSNGGLDFEDCHIVVNSERSRPQQAFASSDLIRLVNCKFSFEGTGAHTTPRVFRFSNIGGANCAMDLQGTEFLGAPVGANQGELLVIIDQLDARNNLTGTKFKEFAGLFVQIGEPLVGVKFGKLVRTSYSHNVGEAFRMRRNSGNTNRLSVFTHCDFGDLAGLLTAQLIGQSDTATMLIIGGIWGRFGGNRVNEIITGATQRNDVLVFGNRQGRLTVITSFGYAPRIVSGGIPISDAFDVKVKIVDSTNPADDVEFFKPGATFGRQATDLAFSVAAKTLGNGNTPAGYVILGQRVEQSNLNNGSARLLFLQPDGQLVSGGANPSSRSTGTGTPSNPQSKDIDDIAFERPVPAHFTAHFISYLMTFPSVQVVCAENDIGGGGLDASPKSYTDITGEFDELIVGDDNTAVISEADARFVNQTDRDDTLKVYRYEKANAFHNDKIWPYAKVANGVWDFGTLRVYFRKPTEAEPTFATPTSIIETPDILLRTTEIHTLCVRGTLVLNEVKIDVDLACVGENVTITEPKTYSTHIAVDERAIDYSIAGKINGTLTVPVESNASVYVVLKNFSTDGLTINKTGAGSGSVVVLGDEIGSIQSGEANVTFGAGVVGEARPQLQPIYVDLANIPTGVRVKAWDFTDNTTTPSREPNELFASDSASVTNPQRFRGTTPAGNISVYDGEIIAGLGTTITRLLIVVTGRTIATEIRVVNIDTTETRQGETPTVTTIDFGGLISEADKVSDLEDETAANIVLIDIDARVGVPRFIVTGHSTASAQFQATYGATNAMLASARANALYGQAIYNRLGSSYLTLPTGQAIGLLRWDILNFPHREASQVRQNHFQFDGGITFERLSGLYVVVDDAAQSFVALTASEEEAGLSLEDKAFELVSNIAAKNVTKDTFNNATVRSTSRKLTQAHMGEQREQIVLQHRQTRQIVTQNVGEGMGRIFAPPANEEGDD